MNIGNFVGIALGMKLVNEKFRPQFGIAAKIGLFFMFLMLFIFMFIFIFRIINFNLKTLFTSICGLYGFSYLLLINPFLQNKDNYYIEFKSENNLDGFKLVYKNKLVIIDYIIDNEGKLAFANNAYKTKCINYADGSKMSKITKFEILNYFSKWLSSNNLLSKSVVSTFE